MKDISRSVSKRRLKSRHASNTSMEMTKKIPPKNAKKVQNCILNRYVFVIYFSRLSLINHSLFP